MQNRHAVLLEAEPATASVLLDWLGEAGWVVDRCDDRAAAERTALELTTPLVILALDAEAVELVQRLRRSGKAMRVLCVGGDPKLAAAARAAGADSVLDLPLSHLAVIEAAQVAPATQALPVRVPHATSLTLTAGALPPEGGAIRPGWFVPLLRRWASEHRTAVLEVRPERGRFCRVFLDRGNPSAAWTQDPETALGALLVRLGAVGEGRLAELIAAARAGGQRLGQVLLTDGAVDRALVERALRVQVAERMAALDRVERGTWALVDAEPVGLAAYDVPAAAVEWAIGGPLPPLTAGLGLCYARLDVAPHHWHLYDPEGRFAGLPRMLAEGSRLRDVAEALGDGASELLRFFVDRGVASVSGRPVSGRAPGPARSAADVGARITNAWRVLADADLYAVIGVSPSATDDEVHAGVAASLALTRPAELPAEISAEDRKRAALLHQRVVEAARVLGDPLRRAQYDNSLAEKAPLPTAEVPPDTSLDLRAARARALMHAGAWVGAAGLLSGVTMSSAPPADLLVLLADARRRACPDDPTAGEAELRLALQVEPGQPQACIGLARLLDARGDRDAARTWARRACLTNPADPEARTVLHELSQ